MRSPQDLIGRAVRLKSQVFERIARRRRTPEHTLENVFLVAAFDAGLRQLVCYGADCRVRIGLDDILQAI